MIARSTVGAPALASSSAAAFFLALAACSSNVSSADGGTREAGTGMGDGGCQPYVSTADLSTPVSLVTQVMPIFQQSCALSASCHGDSRSGPIQVYLGSVDGGGGGATILARIVGVPAAEDPTMSLVAPGDPAHSFLMRKMDGDQCTLALECSGTDYNASYPNCGSSMPSGAATLSPATRDTVRAWIKQGAK